MSFIKARKGSRKAWANSNKQGECGEVALGHVSGTMRKGEVEGVGDFKQAGRMRRGCAWARELDDAEGGSGRRGRLQTSRENAARLRLGT